MDTEKPVHIKPPFTRRSFDTKALAHTHTQMLSHTDAFTQRSLYKQSFDMQKRSNRRCFRRCFCTQKLLHTDAFTQTYFFTRAPLDIEALTRRGFYTQKQLHKEAFPQSIFYRLQFKVSFWHSSLIVFDVRPSSRLRRLRRTFAKLRFYPIF